MNVTNNYKGIKGWFPQSVIKAIDEYGKLQKIKEFEFLWGRKLTEEEIDKIKINHAEI